MASADPQAPPSDAAAPADPGSALKPRLRGMLHLVAFPLSLVAGTILVTVIADGRSLRIGSAFFALATTTLFGFSALYHRGRWNPGTRAVLRRVDHANIFLMIAGSYTPLSLALLGRTSQVVVLTVVWVGAAAGMIFRVVWLSAPRWLYTPFYIALGWVALGVLPEMYRADAGIVVLVAVGGVAHSVGGLVYALRQPDPWPRTFGYHEIFHSCTLIGYACHYTAAALAVA